MQDSYRFKTVESSIWVLGELYKDSPEDSSFACAIAVAAAGLDEVRDVELTLYVERIGLRPHSFQMANGDRVYSTRAQLKPDGSWFPVDVVIRARQAEVAPATISVSDEVERALLELL